MPISRLFEIPGHQLSKYPQNDALAYKDESEWKTISITEFINIVNQVSCGLVQKGVQPGDKIAIVSRNRPEWMFMDYAIQQVGAISVPLYPTITVEDYQFILNDSAATMAFVENQQLHDRVAQAARPLQQSLDIFSFDQLEGIDHWSALKTDTTEDQLSHIENIKSAIDPESLATIIYTSGTTGNPKGVMLSHDNILSNALAVSKIFPQEGPEVRTLSFLPLCHIFERTASFMNVYLGVSIYFAESLDTIGENLREVKPHYFAAVPRLLEKTFEKIMDKGAELSGVKRSLFEWAVSLASKYDLPMKSGPWYQLQLKLANGIIFNKWREALGGNVQFIVSGAAALNPSIGRMFWAAGIPVLEAYGLTESSPGVSFTRLDYQSARIGSVGPALEGVHIKIAEDGEVLVKGPNVMQGYYGRPDLTADTINDDGWLHTGDIGELIDGVLKITDRKKEMFKTSGGKYIAPQLLENTFKESPYIDQMMVVGEGQKFPAALIVPAFERLKLWAEQKDISYNTIDELIGHSETLNLYNEIVGSKNSNFAQFEKIKKFHILGESWTVDSGELTPTMKLKRRIIHSKYQENIDSFYNK